MDWLSIFGWQKQQLDDIRFVGFCYIKEGHYEIGVSFFKALIAINPKNIYDNQILGAIYLETGKYQDALKQLEIALRLDPIHLPTLLNRAKALFSLGRSDQGIKQAKALLVCKDKKIVHQAEALLIAYIPK